jgi:peroxiredoxin
VRGGGEGGEEVSDRGGVVRGVRADRYVCVVYKGVLKRAERDEGLGTWF